LGSFLRDNKRNFATGEDKKSSMNSCVTKKIAVFLLVDQCVWACAQTSLPRSLRAQRRYSLRRGFQKKLIRVGGKETPSHVEGFFSEESKEQALENCSVAGALKKNHFFFEVALADHSKTAQLLVH
jgi:hypothetical protein